MNRQATTKTRKPTHLKGWPYKGLFVTIAAEISRREGKPVTNRTIARRYRRGNPVVQRLVAREIERRRRQAEGSAHV